MKVSVSALLLVLGASDAFAPAPSKRAVTSLDEAFPQSEYEGYHGEVMNGGTDGSSLLAGSYNQVNRDAPWGERFAYVQPAARTPNTHAHNGMSGGTGGSKLVDGPIDLYAAYSPSFAALHAQNNDNYNNVQPTLTRIPNAHATNGLSGGTAGSQLVDGQIDLFAAYSPSFAALHAQNNDNYNNVQPTSTRIPNTHASNGLSGGTAGSQLVDGKIDLFAAYSPSFAALHAHKNDNYYNTIDQPTLPRTANGHAENGLSGGTAGSMLVDGPMDRFSPYSPSYGELHDGPTTKVAAVVPAEQPAPFANAAPKEVESPSNPTVSTEDEEAVQQQEASVLEASEQAVQ